DQMASGVIGRYQTWRGCPGIFCISGVLRQLSLRSLTSESPAGAARFFWRAYLRTDRQARRFSYRMDRVRSKTGGKTDPAEDPAAASRGGVAVAAALWAARSLRTAKPTTDQ